MVLHTIAATQEIPRNTRLHPRGSTRVPPTSRGAPFCLLAREEGSIPCVLVKEFPAFPSHLKRRHSPQVRQAELQGRATITRVLQMSQSIPGKPVSLHCFVFKPRIDSHHGGTWDIPVGKPHGKTSWKASRESHRSLDPHEG